jgi:hypothetical protein
MCRHAVSRQYVSVCGEFGVQDGEMLCRRVGICMDGEARYAGRAYPEDLPYPWVGEGHLDRSGSGTDFGRGRGKTLDVEGIAGRELTEVAMIYRSRTQPAA